MYNSASRFARTFQLNIKRHILWDIAELFAPYVNILANAFIISEGKARSNCEWRPQRWRLSEDLTQVLCDWFYVLSCVNSWLGWSFPVIHCLIWQTVFSRIQNTINWNGLSAVPQRAFLHRCFCATFLFPSSTFAVPLSQHFSLLLKNLQFYWGSPFQAMQFCIPFRLYSWVIT